MLGRITILFVQEIAGDALPELSTFLVELLFDGTHDLGDNEDLFEIYQRVEFCRRRHRYSGAQGTTPPADVVSPTTIKDGDDARLRDMLDLCPFLVFYRIFVVRVDDTFDEEMGPTKP